MSKKGPRIKYFSIFFLSLSGIGFIPWASGTWASAFSMLVPLFFGFLKIGLWLQLFLFVLATFWGTYLCKRACQNESCKDPSWIVFDELLGMWLGSFFLLSLNVYSLLLLFIFFRFFDILKIWPANVVDEKMKTPFGVMLDDLIAGIYAGSLVLVLEIIFKIF